MKRAGTRPKLGTEARIDDATCDAFVKAHPGGATLEEIAEVFGVTSGLGYLMAYARTVFDTALLYAAILAIIILVFVADGLVFARLERLVTRHRADTASTTLAVEVSR